MTGRMKERRSSTRNCVPTSAWFAFSKRASSRFSWTKAFTTRMPETFS